MNTQQETYSVIPVLRTTILYRSVLLCCAQHRNDSQFSCQVKETLIIHSKHPKPYIVILREDVKRLKSQNPFFSVFLDFAALRAEVNAWIRDFEVYFQNF